MIDWIREYAISAYFGFILAQAELGLWPTIFWLLGWGFIVLVHDNRIIEKYRRRGIDG